MFALLRRLIEPLTKRWRAFTPVILFSILTVLLGLATPYFIRLSIDTLNKAGMADEVYWYGLAIFLVALLQGLSDWARLYYMAHLGQQILLNWRVSLFDHLMRLPFSFFDKVHTGDLISRVASDIETLSVFYTRAAVMAFGNLAYLAAIFAVMLIWDYRLALVYLALLPLIGHAMSIYSLQVSPYMRTSREQVAELTILLRNGLTAIDTVQGLGFTERLSSHLRMASERLGTSRTNAGAVVARWRNYPTTVVAIACAACLWYGAILVQKGTLSIGTLIGFTAFFGLLGRPIRQTGFMLSVIIRATAAAERVFEILDVHADVSDCEDAKDLPQGAGTVRFENVHFSYDGDEPIKALRGISTTMQAGQVIALVGPSGSGKTTLAHLIPRFYEPQKGSISIDGVDIKSTTLRSLRRRVGIAFQDSFIFSGTLRNNVAWGKPGADDEEITAALERAQLGDVLRRERDGLDIEVGERGLKLSGGQRQRLALARVLLYDPQILILDEPTASLDKTAEEKLHKALENVRQGRLTVVISHRLWTVQKADHIIVLDNGKIVEEARTTNDSSAAEKLKRAGGLFTELEKRLLTKEEEQQ